MQVRVLTIATKLNNLKAKIIKGKGKPKLPLSNSSSNSNPGNLMDTKMQYGSTRISPVTTKNTMLHIDNGQ